MLTHEQWQAIQEAEVRLYADERGAHAYTSVMHYEDVKHDASITEMWQIAYIAVDAGESYGERWIIAQTGKRVAQAIAVLNFGPEFLLK